MTYPLSGQTCSVLIASVLLTYITLYNTKLRRTRLYSRSPSSSESSLHAANEEGARRCSSLETRDQTTAEEQVRVIPLLFVLFY